MSTADLDALDRARNFKGANMSRLEMPENEYRPSMADSDDMVIQYALSDLVEIQKSGAALSKTALDNLDAIILIAQYMRGEIQ